MVEDQPNAEQIARTVGQVAWKIRARLESELAGRVRQSGSDMDWDELVDDCEIILTEYQDYLATDPSNLRRLKKAGIDLGWRVGDSLECFYSDAGTFGTSTAVGLAAQQIINDELRPHGIALCQRGYLTMGGSE